MNILFKNIRVVNPTENLDKVVNLYIKDGIIEHCSNEECVVDSSTEIIDGSELVAAPGFIDIHTHLREPGFEYKETIKSGTDAAANGGFTAVVCMPNTEPIIDDVTVVEYIKNKSKDLLVDVYIAGSISQNREGKLISPMLELDDAGVVMFTDDGKCVESSEMLRRAFDYATTRDLLISEHCEDHSLTKNFAMDECELSIKLGLKGYPKIAEEIIVARDILLAEYCGNRRLHLQHISTKGSVELIRNAKKKGLRVSCEVTPHHLILSNDLLDSYNTNLKMNPPLRSKDDINALLDGIKDGTIDCIATDHAPHALHEKEVEFEKAPCGITGLETAIGLILNILHHSFNIELNKIVELMSINPRKLLKLKQIEIKNNEKANLTIFAPNEEWIVNSSKFMSISKNMPYENMKLKGRPKFAINNGKIWSSTL